MIMLYLKDKEATVLMILLGRVLVFSITYVVTRTNIFEEADYEIKFKPPKPIYPHS